MDSRPEIERPLLPMSPSVSDTPPRFRLSGRRASFLARHNGPCHHPDCHDWISRGRTEVVQVCAGRKVEHAYHHTERVKVDWDRIESAAEADALRQRLATQFAAELGPWLVDPFDYWAGIDLQVFCPFHEHPDRSAKPSAAWRPRADYPDRYPLGIFHCFKAGCSLASDAVTVRRHFRMRLKVLSRPRPNGPRQAGGGES